MLGGEGGQGAERKTGGGFRDSHGGGGGGGGGGRGEEKWRKGLLGRERDTTIQAVLLLFLYCG